jgi:hypothetical protein
MRNAVMNEATMTDIGERKALAEEQPWSTEPRGD